VAQRGASQTVTSASTIVVETAAQAASQGRIDLLSSGAVGGYAIFR
jgi:hypothetical protein